MRESIRPTPNDDSRTEPTERRTPFLQGLAEFVRDQAIDQVVNKASGGWLSYEGNDDEEGEPRRSAPPADSFNDRIERALAELRAQEQAAPAAIHAPPNTAAPAPSMPPATNPPVGMRTFGRKAV